MSGDRTILMMSIFGLGFLFGLWVHEQEYPHCPPAQPVNGPAPLTKGANAVAGNFRVTRPPFTSVVQSIGRKSDGRT